MERLEKALESRSKKVNKVEMTKALKEPMEVYRRLGEIAAGGYEALSKEESGYFLKCFGLFDKGEDFMLRVRIPAGQLSNAQAIRIGEVARKYGNDYIDITTRMQIELRYLSIEDIAKVLQELEEVGISTFQTGVDNPRNIVTDPLDGIAYDNLIETKPIVDALQALVIENPEWISALPRKFNTGILGSLSNSCNIFGHDCCFVLANREGEFGFNVYLGARVGVQAKEADLFLSADEVPTFFLALLELFKTYGYRDNRNKNRLHFLLQDVGVPAFVEAIRRQAGSPFAPAGQTLVQSQNIALGARRVLQRDGRFAYKQIVPSGIFSGSDMIELAKTAGEFASGDIRLGYDQNCYVIGVDREHFAAFEEAPVIRKYQPYDHLYFRDMIACAGTQTCSFGVIPNKPDAIEMAEFLRSELPIDQAMVRMNWSACPKGCGVHGIADIGFEGCKAKDDEGNRVDGVHLFLGGKITREAREARLLHKALPLKEVKYHVKYLLEPYAEFKLRAETFEAFETRYLDKGYSYQALGFYTKVNYLLREKLGLDTAFTLDREPATYRKEELEIFDFGLKLFKLLTGENRFEAVENFEPVKIKPRKIRRDEVSRINPKVPFKLSEVIHDMTQPDKMQRIQVFSQALMALREV